MYYAAHLKSGVCLNFNKKCKKVLYSHSILCTFFDGGMCLGVIPYENINYILLYTED
uniref:Uncharacterized protein n=1 Tax=Siphoviridae sp. ct9lR64 TaxID=2826178 RepID=A0A8S5QYR8_9CAUD|nr:MAG TPA: hypothetical protein [Siphoviridae sp. ct9lR64]